MSGALGGGSEAGRPRPRANGSIRSATTRVATVVRAWLEIGRGQLASLEQRVKSSNPR